MGKGTPIYIPNPTWGNHVSVFDKAGLEVRRYRYYDANTLGLDFEGMDDLNDLTGLDGLDGVDQTSSRTRSSDHLEVFLLLEQV